MNVTLARNTFSAYAAKNVRIDEDANGLIALVPDQSGRWMTVRCEETKTSVVPTSCSCKKENCKHQAVVASYYAKIYKVEPVKVEAPVAAPKVAKTRKPRNGLVRKVRNGGLVRVEQPKVETPVAKTVEQSKSIDLESFKQAWNKKAARVKEDWTSEDISKKGELRSNQGFRLLR